MKFIFLWPVLFGVLFFTISCEKGKDEIVYPKTGNFGENLLQIDSLPVISSGDHYLSRKSYSMRAELPENTSVKLIIKHKSNFYGHLAYDHQTQQGWSVDYVTITDHHGTTHIYGYGQVVCDMKVYFFYSGIAEIAIYENGDTIPARIKTFAWQE